MPSAASAAFDLAPYARRVESSAAGNEPQRDDNDAEHIAEREQQPRITPAKKSRTTEVSVTIP